MHNNQSDKFPTKTLLRLGGRRINDEIFKSLVAIMDEAIVVMDSEQKIIYVNGKFSQITGFEIDNVIGKEFTDFVKPPSRQILLDEFEKCHQNHKSNFDLSWLDKSGNEIFTRISLRLIDDSEPKNKIFFAVAIDITEFIKAQNLIFESERKYNSVVENSITGIFIEKDGKIIFNNPYFANIFGYSPDKVIGEKITNFFGTNDLRKNFEFETKTKNGKLIWVRLSTNNIVYQGQSVLLGNVIDVTQQKQMEQKLVHSKDELKALSNQLFNAQEIERKRIALELHDGIGQSLSIIKFKIENALKKHEKDIPVNSLMELPSYLANATEEVRRISMALRPFLLDDLGLKATINWYCREYQIVYPEINVKTNINFDETKISDLLKISIFRILQEALNNISKHSQATDIDISLEQIDGKIEMSIKDNGIGIPNELINPTSPKIIGLGLSSMRERTIQTGGCFEIKSEPNQGTGLFLKWNCY